MTDPTPKQTGLTDAEKLAALETYLAALKPTVDTLRAAVTAQMGAMHVERVGAYLPDGTRLASVTRSEGKRTPGIVDEEAALKWCLEHHPEHVQTVQSIRPAYVKYLLEGHGVDPATGEPLPFIEVVEGAPYVTVLKAAEGKARMATLAGGFIGMLEAPPAPTT